MREILIAFSAILAVSIARVVITASESDRRLVGINECTWGPTYWCDNLKTAKRCSAVNHCIEKYWEHMEVPEDNDSVCGICKDMVQQARDQLESNETQQELKDVFEGSCKLIHIKPIIKECISLVDEFIPELVDTVVSQMNPSVVCTVAGLCNNARIDKLLSQYKGTPMKKDKPISTSPILMKNDEVEPDTCTKCYTIAKHMESRLQDMSRDDMARQCLIICRQFGSFSDSCTNIVINHFGIIYDMRKNLNADNICHLSGQCINKYHKHEDDVDTIPKVEITPMSSVGMVEVDDDLPCKLCEQLVGHLKDLLVANTTEIEFKQILTGLCKQTHSFANECKAIVEEYYSKIYEYLTKELNSNFVCQISGICPSPDKMRQGPIWPLIPIESAKLGLQMVNIRSKKEIELTVGKPEMKAEAMQLPIERLVPYPLLDLSTNKEESCMLCEYILHYIQNYITDPVNEEKIKEGLEKVCTTIPSINDICEEFVNVYGDAIVAILVQEIDPSQVCPLMHVCPSKEVQHLWNTYGTSIKEEQTKSTDKPGCPFCLLAVSQIYNVIKENKTEANIENELSKLCNHLPHHLVEQCTDFVKTYSKELVEMLLADLTPQEVCTYLKLCDPSKDFKEDINDDEIETNEISVPSSVIPDSSKLQLPGMKDEICTLCEIMMHYVDKAIGNKRSRDHIENMIHNMCNDLPKSLAKNCNHFIDEYGDIVITILTNEISPKQICGMIGLCPITMKHIEESISDCAICQDMTSEINNSLHKVSILTDKVIRKSVKYACSTSDTQRCWQILKIYGPSFMNLLSDGTDSKELCNKIALCSPVDNAIISFKKTRTKSFQAMEKTNTDIA